MKEMQQERERGDEEGKEGYEKRIKQDGEEMERLMK